MFKKTKLFALTAIASFAFNANAAEETKPFGEWVKILWEEQNAFYKSHPDLIDIEKGAGIAIPAKIKTSIKRGTLMPIAKKWVKAYTEFINGKGKPMLENWKNNGKLNSKNEAYKYVIHATLAKKTRCHANNKEMSNLFAKGYLHENFTRAEIDKMRYFLAATTKKHSGMKYDFANTKWGDKDWESVVNQLYPIKPGTLVPNFTAISYDKIVEKNGLPKASEYKYQVHGFLTPLYLEKYNKHFNGFTPTADKKKLNIDLTSSVKGREDIMISLDEMMKNKKPIFIFARTSDDTFDHPMSMKGWLPLLPIYKNYIDFYYFAIDIIQQDYIMTNSNNVGVKNSPIKDSIVFSSSDTKLSVPLNVLNNFVMRYPYFPKTKALCEKTNMTLQFSIIPNYFNLFIDENGINCASDISTRHGLEGYIVQMQYGNKRKRIKATAPRAGYAWLYWIKTNRTIQFFKIMERLNWKYSATDKELHDFYANNAKTDIAEFARYTIKKGVVKEITEDKIIINGADDLNKKDVIDHTIIINDKTRTANKGNKFGHQIKEIKVGDKVSAIYRYKTNAMKEKIAIVVFRHEKGKIGFGRRFFITSKVTGVDAEKGTIQTQMEKPTDWVGYKLWEERIAKGAKEPSGREGASYQLGKKLLNGTDADRAFNLNIDSGVDFSIDGIDMDVKNIEKVEVGDNIIFSLLLDSERINTNAFPENVYIIKPIK